MTFKRKLAEVFSNQKEIEVALRCNENCFKKEYNEELYGKIINFQGNKFSDKSFIKMIYDLLVDWGMNSRGAKLACYKDFEESILTNAPNMKLLADKTIDNIDDQKVLGILRQLFDNLVIVFSEQETKFVAFTKAMHLFFPSLVAPIDSNIHKFFFGRRIQEGKDKQFERIIAILKEYKDFARKTNLDIYRNGDWNKYLPKIIDNMVIGQVKQNGTSKETVIRKEIKFFHATGGSK